MTRPILALVLVAGLAAGGIAVVSTTAIGDAVADEVRADAGVPTSPAAATTTTATVETPTGTATTTVTTLPAVLKDPVDNPAGFAGDVKGAFRTSQWFFLVVLGLFGLARALLYASARWSLPWLKNWAPVLVTASGLLASVGASLGSTGRLDWQATLGALFAAGAIYLRPGAKPVAVPQP